MVRSLHQLFCFPRLTDADHLEQQKQKNKHEAPLVIPSLQLLFSTKTLLLKTISTLQLSVLCVDMPEHLYSWLGFKFSCLVVAVILMASQARGES